MTGLESSPLIGLGFDDWCSDCGVNPVAAPGRCSSCEEDHEFENCPFCEGTGCTQACEDDEEWRLD